MRVCWSSAFMILVGSAGAAAAPPDRENVAPIVRGSDPGAVGTLTPPALGTRTWELDAQFPNESSWTAAFQSVEGHLMAIGARRSRPISKAGDLLQLLDAVAAARGGAGALARFALLKSSLDARSDSARARLSAATQLEARVEVATAWLDPMLRALGQRRVEHWAAAEPGLRRHGWLLAKVFRDAPHFAPVGAEPVLADLTRASQLPLDAYRALLTADLGWQSIATRHGPVRVDFLSYPDLKRDPDRTVREAANQAFFERLRALEQPLGLLLARRAEMQVAGARARHFDNGIDAFFALDDGIPVGSYRQIFRTARAGKPTAVRYLKLLGRLHGLAHPALGDLYAPPPSASGAFTASDVLEDVVSTWAPMGREYQALLRQRLSEPWMDLSDSPDKDGSAGGVYWAVGGGHPYVFLKFKGDLPSAESLSAAAALMMFYEDIPLPKRPQRREDDFPVYSNAVWFAGELLYTDYLLSKAQLRQQRLALIASELYRMWNAYFQFAIATELEDWVESQVSQSKGVSGAGVSSRYLALLTDYYGSPDVEVAPMFAEQWMTFPYLFDARHILPEWAMAMAAGADMVRRLGEAEPRMVRTFRAPLANAGSFTSYDLLRDAGIRIDSALPYEALILRMNTLMDRLDAELGV